MARLSDLADWERTYLLQLRDKLAPFDSTPWVDGPPLRERRVALISTAGLHRRGDRPFGSGASEYRVIPGDTPAAELAMSHVSMNFDRSGFRRDPDVVFPLDRLRELADDGTIGSVADFHYSFMGATMPPARFAEPARGLAELLARDRVDAAVLLPV